MLFLLQHRKPSEFKTPFKIETLLLGWKGSLLIICLQGCVVSVKSIWNDLFYRRGLVASVEG